MLTTLVPVPIQHWEWIHAGVHPGWLPDFDSELQHAATDRVWNIKVLQKLLDHLTALLQSFVMVL